MIFPDQISAILGGMLDNGITAGGFTAILLMLFLKLTSPRPSRFEADFTIGVLPELRGFLSAFVARNGWGDAMMDRLDAASEETLLTLLTDDETGTDRPRRLRVTARRDGHLARMEFVVSVGDENQQDRIACLGRNPANSRLNATSPCACCGTWHPPRDTSSIMAPTL